jgi:hypothetical protein
VKFLKLGDFSLLQGMIRGQNAFAGDELAKVGARSNWTAEDENNGENSCRGCVGDRDLKHLLLDRPADECPNAGDLEEDLE